MGAITELDSLADYAGLVGRRFGPGDWTTIGQAMIDAFGEATGDRNWYHVDIARARRELPGGRTIAHGLLTLSLVPDMAVKILAVRRHGRAFNYGFDRVRFPEPVPVDSRIRLHVHVVSAERAKGGTFIRKGYTMELEGAAKPALSTGMPILAYDPPAA